MFAAVRALNQRRPLAKASSANQQPLWPYQAHQCAVRFYKRVKGKGAVNRDGYFGRKAAAQKVVDTNDDTVEGRIVALRGK